jgi:hypothetical protein
MWNWWYRDTHAGKKKDDSVKEEYGTNTVIMRKLCSSHLPWPINMAYANSIQNQVVSELEKVYGIVYMLV